MSGKKMLARRRFGRIPTGVANRQLPRECPRGFTLIELLVVISILVMLMAILLPTLQRVHKQAKAVACQAKLRQWGLAFKMYTDAEGGRLFSHPNGDYSRPSTWNFTSSPALNWPGLASPSSLKIPDFLACPMAIKGGDGLSYDPFTAWCRREWGSPYRTRSGETIRGPISYCISYFVAWPPRDDPRLSTAQSNDFSQKDFLWGTCDVRDAARIPVLFDGVYEWPRPDDHVSPPLLEAGPLVGQIRNWSMCINRHVDGVNLLFMDWSARKVGLKELWTFKWHKRFNTAGAWTRQGGVAPEDWPEWMRRFKDY